MATYHVLLYSYEDVYRGNDFLFHAFVSDKSKIQSILETAEAVIAKHAECEEDIDEEDIDIVVRYYGIEELPIDIGEGWFLFAGGEDEFLQYELSLLESHGNVDLAKLAEYKRYRLTIDYDYDGESMPTHVFSIIEKLKRLDFIKGYKFYRTRRGFHLRAELTRPLDFKEKIKIREELYDDSKRIDYDTALMNLGYEALTDLLFNEKYWYDDELDAWEYYEEKPLVITSVNLKDVLYRLRDHVEYYADSINECRDCYDVDDRRVLMDLDLPDFYVRNNVLTFRRPMTPEAAWEIVKNVLRDPLKYAGMHLLRNSKNIEEAAVKAYCMMSWEACEVIKMARLAYDNDSKMIVVYLPGVASYYAGALIGKGGSRVKFVEKLLNTRIKIVTEYTPPHVEAKKKKKELQELMRKLAGDHDEKD